MYASAHNRSISLDLSTPLAGPRRTTGCLCKNQRAYLQKTSAAANKFCSGTLMTKSCYNCLATSEGANNQPHMLGCTLGRKNEQAFECLSTSQPQGRLQSTA